MVNMQTIDEDARRRFESDWLAGQSLSIRNYLPKPDQNSYLGTLEELVCIDLEFRWKPSDRQYSESNQTVTSGQATVQTRVEDYIREFPELNSTEVIQRLVEQEILVRIQSGYVVEPSEFASRFPEVTIDESLFTEVGDKETVVFAGCAAQAQSWVEFPQPFGSYELLEILGSGGMGSVYRARQEAAGREVAVKIADLDHVSPQGRAQLVQRFQTEALTAASVTHDHIVPIYDVGVHDERPYIAMQMVAGGDLSVMSKAEPLLPKRAAKYIHGIASALHQAHKKGLLHRDIKPGNILLDASNDRAMLTDFGLARFLADDTGMTQTGQLLGTPSFMPPEQIKDSSNIDARADVYALGGTLYQLLTGKPPFKAADMHETLRQVAAEDAVAPRIINSAIDRDIDTICVKCLEKEPEARYQTADELAVDLHLYLEGKPILSRPAGPIKRLVKWCKRNKAIAAAQATAVAAAVITIAIVSVAWWTTAEALANEQVALRKETVALGKETEARQAEMKARVRAEEARDTFSSSFNEMYAQFSSEPAFNMPSLEPLRLQFLRDSKVRFESLIAVFQDDETLVIDNAIALSAIADLNAELKLAPDEIKISLDSALAAFDMIPPEIRKKKPEVLAAESNMFLLKGKQGFRSGKVDVARASFLRCTELRQQWSKVKPESLEAKRKLANAVMNEGVLYRKQAQLLAIAEQGEEANEALAIAEGRLMDAQQIRSLAMEKASSMMLLRLKRDFARAQFNLAFVFLSGGELAECITYLESASRALGDLAHEVQDDQGLWLDFVSARIRLAELSAEQPGFNPKSEQGKVYRDGILGALKDIGALAKLRDRNTELQLNLLGEYQNGLDALVSVGHLDQTRDRLRDFEKLADSVDERWRDEISAEAPASLVVLKWNYLKHQAFLAQGFEDSDAVAKVEEAISAYESRSDLISSSPRIASDLEMLRNALRALRAAPAP